MTEVYTAASKTGKTPLLISMGLFAAACALPALVLHIARPRNNTTLVWGGYASVRGATLLFNGLLLGWTRANFTAFANPPLWLSWVFFMRSNFAAARLTAAIALVLSVETLQLMFQPYWFNEAASPVGYLAAPHVGFFCWIGSMFVIWFSSGRVGDVSFSAGS